MGSAPHAVTPSLNWLTPTEIMTALNSLINIPPASQLAGFLVQFIIYMCSRVDRASISAYRPGSKKISLKHSSWYVYYIPIKHKAFTK